MKRSHAKSQLSPHDEPKIQKKKTEAISWTTWVMNFFIEIKYCFHATYLDALSGAIDANDIKAVKYFLNVTDINERDKNGVTPLDKAIFKDRYEIAEILVENDANVNVNKLNEFDTGPLFQAVSYGRDAIARMLVENNADVNIPDAFGVTPLSQAISSNQNGIVRMLVEKGAYVNGLVRECTPLYRAVYFFNGNIEIIQMLLNGGADVNVKSDNGDTPLRLAISRCLYDVAKVLIDDGKADINEINEDGATMLHDAVLNCTHDESPEIEKIKKLVELGANVNIVDFNDQTPLEEVASCGRLAAVRCLLSLPKVIENKEQCGNALALNKCVTLLEAVKAADTQLVNQLLEYPEVRNIAADVELLNEANRCGNQNMLVTINRLPIFQTATGNESDEPSIDTPRNRLTM